MIKRCYLSVKLMAIYFLLAAADLNLYAKTCKSYTFFSELMMKLCNGTSLLRFAFYGVR
jgi:hypothetical protein